MAADPCRTARSYIRRCQHGWRLRLPGVPYRAREACHYPSEIAGRSAAAGYGPGPGGRQQVLSARVPTLGGVLEGVEGSASRCDEAVDGCVAGALRGDAS